jgi:hypothetical protein
MRAAMRIATSLTSIFMLPAGGVVRQVSKKSVDFDSIEDETQGNGLDWLMAVSVDLLPRDESASSKAS